jgi:hypothetical protein
MRYVAWLFVLSALFSPLWGQTTLATEAVKKMVVFIYAADADGNADKKKPLATGFLVLVPLKGSSNLGGGPGDVTGQMFLVTARHVVDPAWAFCSTPQPNLVYIRVNKKDYDPTKDATGVDYLRVDLVKNRVKQYFVRDDDDKVDAAVVDVGLDIQQAKYDVVPMRLSVFASSDEMKKLQIGDSVASAGLLPGRSGEKRNYPFFKFGEISNIPDEPIWMACDRGMPELRAEHTWFIAANLVGGNSGSPIFYVPLPMCLPGSGVTCIRGLNRGAIIGVQSSTFDGADIAGMTPIEDVFKIIEKHSLSGLDLYTGDESKRPK